MTDGRTVDDTPLTTQIRFGMSVEEVERILGKRPMMTVLVTGGQLNFYRVGPDRVGRWHDIMIGNNNETVSSVEVKTIPSPKPAKK